VADAAAYGAFVEENVTEEGPLGDEIWRIVNPNLTNSLGQHPGYELRAGHSAFSLLARDDFPQRRAAFSAAPLWITAYDPKELYAAGPYPNQSKGGDGLLAYVARHRPIVNADITLWYTMGFHHLPRPEDWPILSTIWHTVSAKVLGRLGGGAVDRGHLRNRHRQAADGGVDLKPMGAKHPHDDGLDISDGQSPANSEPPRVPLHPQACQLAQHG
jgi:hypothetical protein